MALIPQPEPLAKSASSLRRSAATGSFYKRLGFQVVDTTPVPGVDIYFVCRVIKAGIR